MTRVIATTFGLLYGLTLSVFVVADEKAAAIENDIKQARESLRRTDGSGPFFKEHAKKRIADWQAAAKKGWAEGLWLVGRCYTDGVGGLEQDHEKALELIRQSARKGFALAQNSLAVMLENGEGTKRDPKEALKWYLEAAKKGEAVAMNNLGRVHEGVEGFKADEKKSLEWYEKAAEKKYFAAMTRLAALAEDRDDHREAVKWYRRSSDAGDQQGTAKLLLRVLAGRGVPKDEDDVKRLRAKLKEQAGSDADDYLLVVDMLEDPLGKKAPNAKGTIAGKKFALNDHLGKVVLMKFGADWCGHCREMAPALKAMSKRLEGKPFVLLDIDTDKNPELARRWGIESIPATFVIDPKGIIRKVGNRGKALDRAVDDLVAKAEKEKK